MPRLTFHRRPGLLAAATLALLLAGCAKSAKNSPLPPPQPVPDPAAQAGNRLLNHALVSPLPGVPPLQITLPAGYLPERVDGNDYTVFYLRHRQLKAGVGIYLGPAPRFHHQRDPYLSVNVEKGRLGSRQVDWHRYQNKGLWYAETIVPDIFKSLAKSDSDPLAAIKLHLFLAAPNPQLLADLESAAGAIGIHAPTSPAP